MFKKLLRLVAILSLLIVFGTAIGYVAHQPERPMREPLSTSTSAIKVVQTIDLNGVWKSEKPPVTATIQSRTIEVQSVVAEPDGHKGLVRWWYGTFDDLKPGETAVVSTGAEKSDKFYLSTAATKDFIYDPNAKLLRFQISTMAVTQIVELKRV